VAERTGVRATSTAGSKHILILKCHRARYGKRRRDSNMWRKWE